MQAVLLPETSFKPPKTELVSQLTLSLLMSDRCSESRRRKLRSKKWLALLASHKNTSQIMAKPKSENQPLAPIRFGEWLRGLREAKGLPLRTVAGAAQMDQAHLSKVELGQRLLTPEQGAAIAIFFGLSANEMEARRIVEKFRLEHADNPAAEQAINMLHEAPAIYRTK